MIWLKYRSVDEINKFDPDPLDKIITDPTGLETRSL